MVDLTVIDWSPQESFWQILSTSGGSRTGQGYYDVADPDTVSQVTVRVFMNAGNSCTLSAIVESTPADSNQAVTADAGDGWYDVTFTLTPAVNASLPHCNVTLNNESGNAAYWAYDPGGSGEEWVYAVGTVGSSAPSKASNPSPADGVGPGIDFSGDEEDPPTLSWTGDGDTYDIYGGGGGNWVLLEQDTASTSYTLTAYDMLLLQCGSSATPVQWRVDSKNDIGTTIGDVWSFDPRPAKVTAPSPTDTATGQSIYQVLGWAASTYATGYDVWVNGNKHYTGTEDTSVLPLVAFLPLAYGTEFTWRVDSVNYYGTTEGDEWTFTTLDWDPPHVTVRSLATGEVVLGPFDPLTMYITGENFMAGMRRLLLFCGGSLWYESVDEADE